MKKISKYFILFTIGFIFNFSNVLAENSNNINSNTIDKIKYENKINQFIIETQKKYNIPGLSFAIIFPKENEPITMTTGYTSILNENPLSQNSLFQVASITKTFTGALLKQEIENKKISLQDKLSQFFPQYPEWGSVTVEQLENQTSGIFDYIQAENWWEYLLQNKSKIWKPEDLLNIAYRHPSNFKPGNGWAYSNTNYVLLGQILQKVTSKNVDELMNQLIQNSKLQNTYYFSNDYPEHIGSKLVHGNFIKNDVFGTNGSWLSSAGAIVSTPSDVIIWMKNLFQKNKLDETKIQLTNTQNGKLIQSMEDTGYGYGLFRMNTPLGHVWFTPGLAPGIISAIVYSPCLNIYFSYSTNRAPLRYFHAYMIKNVLGLFINDESYMKYLEKNKLTPNYCKSLKPSADFNFPPMG